MRASLPPTCIIRHCRPKANSRDLYGQAVFKRLCLFGSALREDFGPHSNIDRGVVFSRNGVAGGFNQHFDFKSELEQLLGRPVDLVCVASVRNSVLRRELERNKKLIHAA